MKLRAGNMTLTIELPDDLTAVLEPLSEADRLITVIALMRAGYSQNSNGAGNGRMNGHDGNDTDEPPFVDFPEPGFAESYRLAREARGDFRSGWEIVKEKRALEEAHRLAVFRGETE